MTYTLVHKGKEYTFAIDRQGKGQCIYKGDARSPVERSSVDVVLHYGLAQMMWRGWETAGEATDETREFEKDIDRHLGDVIRRAYPAESS